MSIRRHTTWNFLGSIAPMILGVAVAPYLIGRVGLEAFGVLTLVWALVGYFSIFDFGIGRALTQQVASRRAGPGVGDLSSLIKSGLIVVGTFGMVGAAGLSATAYQFGHVWLNVSEALQQSTTDCLFIAAAGIPLATLVAGLRGVLEGFEAFRTANILRVVLGCANFGLPALSVAFFGPSLELMVASLVFARLAILGAHVIAVNTHVCTWGGANSVDQRATRALLSFGGWMTVSNLISPLMVTADRFVISYVLGASLVAYYTIPFDFIVRLLVVPASLTSSLFPRFAYLFSSNIQELRQLYRKGLRAMVFVMVPLCALLVAGAKTGLTVWLGAAFAEASWKIAIVLSLGLLFNGLAQIPHAAVQAAGGVRTTAFLHGLEFCLYVPALCVGVVFFGLIGAAVVWLGRVLIDLIALLTIARQRLK